MNTRFLLLMSIALLSGTAQAQVGINTNNPDPNADLELGSSSKALLLNRVTDTSAIATPANGMLVYDISSRCFRGYMDNTWSDCIGSVTHLLSLDCAGANHTGTITSGNAASGVSTTVDYTGGNGSAYNAQSINSTGVTGLTATLSAGALAVGAGSLTYSITGTPSDSGTATFALHFGGQDCSFDRQVVPVVPATITLAQDRMYFITSIYDQDYLPYSVPSGSATSGAAAADGSNEPTAIDIQGSLSTSGIMVRIPVTATASGTLNPYSTTLHIPASMTQDGVDRDVMLSWNAQTYTTATHTITATIKAVSGTLKVLQLDQNAGVGNDGMGILIGSLSYPYNNAGSMTTYQLRAIAGIPDRMFGLTDNTGTSDQHLMLYSPVQAEDGRIWLSNNLGADYSKINNSSFNPAQQATVATDYHAYGSLFQWGRKPDGHELILWTSSTTGTMSSTTTINSDVPNHTQFINESFAPYDWRINTDLTLWASESSSNNPCPSGYRVPMETELTQWVSAAAVNDINTAAASVLKLSTTGARINTGSSTAIGTTALLWSNTPAGSYLYFRSFDSSSTTSDNSGRHSSALAVRCIKD